MQHIVERIIDGLPVYLKDGYPKFVELLRAYYTWQAQDGKFLDGVYGHEANIDVDREGLGRVISEMDEGDVPVQHRRTFVMFARQFNASRGSLASFDNFFRIFFDAPVRITNSARYVFMPSSAVRERYHRAIITSATPLPASGVLRQSFGGGIADIVSANCLASRGNWTYEITVVLRNESFFPGAAVVSHGTTSYPVEFVPFVDFAATAGHNYEVGDDVEVVTDLMTFIGVVSSLQPISVESVNVVAGGSGYAIGNVVTIPGARGFRGEVSAIAVGGAITEVRVIDSGDPFGGIPTFFIATASGTGAYLSYGGISGRPLALSFDKHPFGAVTAVVVTSDSGQDAAFAQSPRLFHHTWIPRGYNGVIGIGTILTDSAAYQDASYIVATPVDADKWVGKVKKLLHPVGRYMHAVKTAGGVVSIPGIVSSTGHASPYEYLEASWDDGVSATPISLMVPPPPIDLSLLLDVGQASDTVVSD